VRVDGAEVSASFFVVLRVRHLHGRGLVAGENEPGRNKVVVLGYPLWRDRFGADPAVVGRTVSLYRQPYVVVGVAPPLFRYPQGRGGLDADRLRRALPVEQPGRVVPRRRGPAA
jgi:putative ABC transport system permease protein